MKKSVAALKNDFIRAYQYEYGASKKKALSVWNECCKSKNHSYICALVECYNSEVNKSFYCD